MYDPRTELVQAIMTSSSPDDFYRKVYDLIVDDEGVINFYMFDIGAMLIRAFYERSRLSDEEVESFDIDNIHKKHNIM